MGLLGDGVLPAGCVDPGVDDGAGAIELELVDAGAVYDGGPLVVGERVRLLRDRGDDPVEFGIVRLGDPRSVSAVDLGGQGDRLLHLLIGVEEAIDQRDADLPGLAAQVVGGVEDDLRVQVGDVLEVEVVAEGHRRIGHGWAHPVHPGEPIGAAVRGDETLGLGEHDRHLVVRVPAVGVLGDARGDLDLRAAHIGDGLGVRSRRVIRRRRGTAGRQRGQAGGAADAEAGESEQVAAGGGWTTGCGHGASDATVRIERLVLVR